MPLHYNATQGWPTVAEILHKASNPPDQAPAEITSNRWVYAILMGMALGGGEDTYSVGTNWLQTAVVAAGVGIVAASALLMGAASAVRRAWRFVRRLPPAGVGFGPDRTVAFVLLLAIAVNAAAAHGAVRHLHPAALLAFAVFGALPVALFGTSRRLWLLRALVSLALLPPILVPNGWTLPRDESVYGDRPAFGSAVAEVVDGLTERGLTRGYADYWSAYPLTYWSGERIVVSPVAPMTYGGHFERYPEYTAEVHRQPSFDKVFLLLETQCDMHPYTAPLAGVGGRWQIDRLGPYWLMWDMWTPPDSEPAALQTWRTLIESKESC
jgi:hypothetical protein